MIGFKVILNKDKVKNHTCPKGRENNKHARIKNYLPEYGEGAVVLDRDLHGCLYWNIEDLIII